MPQPPERCLSRKAGIMRCCLKLGALAGVSFPPSGCCTRLRQQQAFRKIPVGAGYVRPATFLYRPFPFPAFCINKKALLKSEQGLKRSRHLPIFTGRFQPTIFGTSELNFCVRNGNRWNLTVIDTGHSHGACHASLLLRMYPQN